MVAPIDNALTSEAGLFPEDAPAANSRDTREVYLQRATSSYAKVRHVLIQRPPSGGKGSQPSMLPHLKRNHRAAVLYLALLANWPWLRRQAAPLPAATWIRFLGSEQRGSLTWTPQALSHAWGVLEELKLVERQRKGRLVNVRPLKEDGSGGDYASPTGKGGDSYFALPKRFWLDEHHATLSWPGLAVLLILLKETNQYPVTELAIDRAQAYYGISRTTAESGLSELRARGLLLSSERRVADVDHPEGRRLASLHRLSSPYSTEERRELRDAANRSVALKGKEALANGEEPDEPSP
ncbi:hypothetical protein PX701_11725 [Agromyces sp. H3Y2-19a]|uniref:hypothetical protein n=1 Tax=Agromyces chromiiresistens TaxID=3030835 RepID=UPI0023B8C3E0|nr:hypothetical protein [Agromyces chromiiresistens]MDF0514292.1 hypothetical protein [Agromyces chromiiresistens]